MLNGTALEQGGDGVVILFADGDGGKVRDVQVIGVPDKRYGEEAMACIILKEGESMTVEEMDEYIKSHLARHKVPKYIEFVDEFPMNAAGKVLKYKMREDAVKRLNLE